MIRNNPEATMNRGSEKTREKAQTRWLAGFKERQNARIRLFCFPYAGGSAASFRSWQQALPEFIQAAAVQPPGRGERLAEPPFKHLPEMVQALGPELLPYFDKPFAFFGHSMGALIVLELARWLRRNGKPMPVHLFVSGRRAPQLPNLEPNDHDLPEDQFIERLRELNGTPPEVFNHPELLQLMIPLLRADFSVCETYEHHAEAALNCPLTVFGGIGDVEVKREQLEPWREHTAASFALQMFPGDHFFIQSAQRDVVRAVSQKLL